MQLVKCFILNTALDVQLVDHTTKFVFFVAYTFCPDEKVDVFTNFFWVNCHSEGLA